MNSDELLDSKWESVRDLYNKRYLSPLYRNPLAADNGLELELKYI